MLVGSVRRDGGFERTVKGKVPAASGEAPVSMSSSAVVLAAPEDGGTWGKAILPPSPPEKGRAETVNMSELLRAVRDCSIDFSAQLFAHEALLPSPERCPSTAGAVPVP